MKITAVDTVRLSEFPNVLWVRVHTACGLTGLGETFFGAKAVEAYIHESAAPMLLGRDARQIERIARDLTPYVGYSGSGAETRGRSAIDVALWDLLGQHAGLPVYQLLGGLTRECVRTYNTCAGYRYVRHRPDWSTEDWGHEGEAQGPYEDLDAFLHRADELAISLLDQGITGMKIWPFDFAAVACDGYFIAPGDLQKALEPFARIRSAVGDRMDIMVELHGLWRFPAITQIVQALQPYRPFWVEDPLRPDSLDALAELSRSTSIPICGVETLGGAGGFTSLIERGVTAIVMPDIVWCGGFTGLKRIASLAEAHHRPLAPHDCTGPVAFMAAVHASLSLPNVLVQESVRAFYDGWYKELVTTLPEVRDGMIWPPSGSGLGTSLKPEIITRDDACVQLSGSL